MDDGRALVIVPTYDEAENITAALGLLRAAAPAADVLVVDDGSPDGTGAIAERLADADAGMAVLHRQQKAGLGGAYRAGFRWGLERGYVAFVEMDADLSHDPRVVPVLLAALGGADVVIGSRYVADGQVVDWPPHRLRLSRGGNRYVRLVTGLPVADATSGFRAYRRAVLETLDLDEVHSEGYCFQIDMALRAWRAGYRIVELPITFTERRAGASKISRRIVVEAVLRSAGWGLTGSRRMPPPHRASMAAGRGA